MGFLVFRVNGGVLVPDPVPVRILEFGELVRWCDILARVAFSVFWWGVVRILVRIEVVVFELVAWEVSEGEHFAVGL